MVLGTRMTARHADVASKITAFMEFGAASIRPPGWDLLTDRLADDDDPFDFDQLSDVFAYVLEQWTADPTG